MTVAGSLSPQVFFYIYKLYTITFIGYSICYVHVYYYANPKEVTKITALVPEIFIRAYSKILNVQENSIVFTLL